MEHWLVYWRNYWQEKGNPTLVTADWHSSYDQLYEEAALGDEIWVVVTAPAPFEHQWRLLERFSLQAKQTIDRASEGYRYLFVGAPQSHQVFDPMAPNDLTTILTSLAFASDRPIRLSGRQIGQALQVPRKLAALDAKKLDIFARGLPTVTDGALGTA